MNTKSYPKILIISSYNFLEGNDATSITFKSYFGSWPTDNIGLLHCRCYEIHENSEKHNIGFYHFLNILDIKYNFLLKLRRNPTAVSELQSMPVILKKSSLKQRTKQFISVLFKATADMLPYRISPKLEESINRFKPDVIYSILGNRRTTKLVSTIGHKFKIPIIVHFMDDWPATIYNDSFLTIVQRRIMLADLKNVITNARLCLGISEAMCREYEMCYKKQFYPLMNSVREYVKTDVQNKKAKFCYAGGLHLKRADSLLILCDILNEKYSESIEFTIYTKESDWNIYENIFDKFKFVKYGGFKPSDEIYELMKLSDILIFVESFDPSVQNYTRLSISTKIPEYLSLGKIILAIGPSNIASIKYLYEHHVAHVVDRIDKNLFKQKLEMIFNGDEKESILESGKTLFIKNHLQENQRRFLHEMICNIKKTY